MKKSQRGIALLLAMLVASLLLGLGSCAARVPVTVSADSPTNEPADPAAPDDNSECDLQFAGGIGEAGAGQTTPYNFCDSPNAPKRGNAVR